MRSFIYPLCFLTAYKSCDIVPVLAGSSDPKNPDPYYWTYHLKIYPHVIVCAFCSKLEKTSLPIPSFDIVNLLPPAPTRK